MAQSLGSLYVELKAETGAFVTGMSKASYEAKKAAKEIQSGFNEMGSAMEEALGKLGPVGEGLSSLGSAASSVFSGLSGAGSIAAVAVSGFTLLATGAIAAAGALGAMAIAGADVIEHLENLSAITGISTGDLQDLQAAGSLVGVSLDDIVLGTKRFDQAIAGVGKGAGTAAAILKDLGVSSRDPKEALLEVADAFQTLAPGVDKSNIAVALFGKSGRELIPLLDQGRAGILAAGLAVDQYGVRVNESGVKATEDYRLATTKLSTAWEGFKIELAGGVLPTISTLVTKMSDATKGVREFVSATLAHPGDVFDQVVLYGTPFADVAGNVNKDSAASKPKPADTSADNQKQIAAAQNLNKIYQQRYELLAAGGAAALKLSQAREAIEGHIATGNFQQAAAVQATIPALEKAVELEKAQAAEAARMLAIRKELLDIINQGRGGTGSAQLHTSFRSHQSLEPTNPYAGAPDIDAGAGPLNPLASVLGGPKGPQGTDIAKAALADFYSSWGTDAKKSADDVNSTYADELKTLQGYLALGEISQQQFNDARVAMAKANEAALKDAYAQSDNFGDQFKSFVINVGDAGKDVSKSFFADMSQALDGLNQQLAKFIVTGKGLNLQKLGQGLEQNLTSTFLKKGESELFGAIGFGGGKPGTASNPLFVKSVDPLGALGGGAAGGAGGIGSLFGGAGAGGGIGSLFSKLPSLFAGFFAAGGDVSPGKLHVVGENGPEFFIPHAQGRVAPTLKTSAGPAPVNLAFHVHGVTDSDSFVRSQAQTFASLQQQLQIAASRSR